MFFLLKLKTIVFPKLGPCYSAFKNASLCLTDIVKKEKKKKEKRYSSRTKVWYFFMVSQCPPREILEREKELNRNLKLTNTYWL